MSKKRIIKAGILAIVVGAGTLFSLPFEYSLAAYPMACCAFLGYCAVSRE